jgi:hypothetical protein
MKHSDSVILLALLVSVGCTAGGDVPPRAQPSPPVEAPSQTPKTSGVASPMPAAEVEPRFDGRTWRLPPTLAEEMRGTTWKPGCPVPLEDLRLLRFNYWNFDREVSRGPMVVHEEEAEDVLWVFGRLFKARFAIKHLALARGFVPEEFEPRISSARTVTASFNCRPVITPPERDVQVIMTAGSTSESLPASASTSAPMPIGIGTFGRL